MLLSQTLGTIFHDLPRSSKASHEKEAENDRPMSVQHVIPKLVTELGRNNLLHFAAVMPGTVLAWSAAGVSGKKSHLHIVSTKSEARFNYDSDCTKLVQTPNRRTPGQ